MRAKVSSLELASQCASSLPPWVPGRGRESASGSQSFFQRWTAGSGTVQWISSSSVCEGCQVSVFIGEWWINTATGLPVWRDQIHAVVGVESDLVARSVPGVFGERMEMPCLRTGDLEVARAADVGGLAGCGALT